MSESPQQESAPLGSPGAGAGGNANPNGRHVKHINRACDVCRDRKYKCDGSKPTCGACRGSHKQCHYTYRLDRRCRIGKREVDEVNARIDELEREVRMLRRDRAQLVAENGAMRARLGLPTPTTLNTNTNMNSSPGSTSSLSPLFGTNDSPFLSTPASSTRYGSSLSPSPQSTAPSLISDNSDVYLHPAWQSDYRRSTNEEGQSPYPSTGTRAARRLSAPGIFAPSSTFPPSPVSPYSVYDDLDKLVLFDNSESSSVPSVAFEHVPTGTGGGGGGALAIDTSISSAPGHASSSSSAPASAPATLAGQPAPFYMNEYGMFYGSLLFSPQQTQGSQSPQDDAHSHMDLH